MVVSCRRLRSGGLSLAYHKCLASSPDAPEGLRLSVAGRLKLDMDGRASFRAVPLAPYHVFAFVLYNNHHLVWDLQIDLKPGANTLVMDQRTAVTLTSAPPPFQNP